MQKRGLAIARQKIKRMDWGSEADNDTRYMMKKLLRKKSLTDLLKVVIRLIAKEERDLQKVNDYTGWDDGRAEYNSYARETFAKLENLEKWILKRLIKNGPRRYRKYYSNLYSNI